MNWIVVDLDCTLIDTKRLVESGGPEPKPAGSEEHAAWVKKVTEPDELAKASPVETVRNFVLNAEGFKNANIIFVTNRRESMRPLTQAWLNKHFLLGTLYMRPEGNLLNAGDFKSGVVKSLVSPTDTVIVLDDDPDGSIEAVCKDNRWTHFKVTTY